MALPAWVLPAAKAAAPWAAQAALGFIGDRFQKNQRMELAKYEFKRNKEMWELNNQYNSPLSQMNRYREAGLNPALMYGQGTPGNSQTPPKFEAPQYDSKLNFPNPLETIAQSQNVDIQRQQIENLEAQRLLTKSQIQQNKVRTLNEAARYGSVRSRSKIDQLRLKYTDELLRYQTDTASATLDVTRNNVLLQDLDKQLKQWEIDLNKEGFSKTDPVQWRLLAQAMQRAGVEPEDILRKFMDNGPIMNRIQGEAIRLGQSAYEWLFNDDNAGKDVLGRPLNRNK